MAVIAVTKETRANETRVAATPETVKKLVALGARVLLQRGAGEPAFFPDAAYAGAEFTDDADGALAQADVLACVQPPSNERLRKLKPGAVVIGLLAPHADPARVEAFVAGELVKLVEPITGASGKYRILTAEHKYTAAIDTMRLELEAE